jgi:hypothetical protein
MFTGDSERKKARSAPVAIKHAAAQTSRAIKTRADTEFLRVLAT